MTADVDVTPAGADDAAAIAAIYAEHVRRGVATFEVKPPDEAEIARRMAGVRDGAWPWLAARIDGELVGYAYAAPFHHRAGYRFTCENSIYVAMDRRRLGIGSVLLDALMSEAADRGFRQMIAVVGGADPGSIALHARHGFTERGRLHAVGRKHGIWLDVVYMQRPLGQGSFAMPPFEPE